METDKYTEVTDGDFVTVKQASEVQIKMRDKNVNPSLIHYMSCYWEQTCAVNYFPLSCS